MRLLHARAVRDRRRCRVVGDSACDEARLLIARALHRPGKDGRGEFSERRLLRRAHKLAAGAAAGDVAVEAEGHVAVSGRTLVHDGVG